MKVAVAGGTGLAGSHTVAALEAAGDEVVLLTRSAGVDLLEGCGLDGALDSVEAVVDTTSTPARTAAESVAFFDTVARHLQRAAAAGGVRRVVTLSIVGLEPMAARAHYAGKLAQERETRAGAVPATILRATQFHDFGGQLASWRRKGRFVPVAAQPVQTVDLATVGHHLARLAHGEAEGRTVQLAGPQRSTLPRVVRRTLRARGERGLVVPLWLPGAAERAARHGAALPPPDAVIDGPSFDEWLARQS